MPFIFGRHNSHDACSPPSCHPSIPILSLKSLLYYITVASVVAKLCPCVSFSDSLQLQYDAQAKMLVCQCLNVQCRVSHHGEKPKPLPGMSLESIITHLLRLLAIPGSNRGGISPSTRPLISPPSPLQRHLPRPRFRRCSGPQFRDPLILGRARPSRWGSMHVVK